jgi:hypothetical protein
MEIDAAASAVDGFPRMAAIFFVLQAGGRRQPEDRKAGRRLMVSSESIDSAFQSSTC